MKPFATIVATIAVGLLLFVATGEAARRMPLALAFRPNQIDVNYVRPEAPQYQSLYTLLKDRQALEKIRDLLRPLRLQQRLLLQTRDCDGIANAWADDRSVTVCYELLEEIWKKAPETVTPAGIAPIDTLIGPFVDVFLHEAGHVVFHALQIPIFGREEDAADQFSAYIMLQLDKEESRRLIFGAAYQYKDDLSSPTTTIARQKFADEHGFSEQRFYNLLCIAYGADPVLFAAIVDKGYLPKDRAEICGAEYSQVAQAFETLLGPHIDHRLARKLHKNWLPPVTTKKPQL